MAICHSWEPAVPLQSMTSYIDCMDTTAGEQAELSLSSGARSTLEVRYFPRESNDLDLSTSKLC